MVDPPPAGDVMKVLPRRAGVTDRVTHDQDDDVVSRMDGRIRRVREWPPGLG
jgi:hypothetical protein